MTLIKKLKRLRVCNPECQGRCEFCPGDVVMEATTRIEELERKLAAAQSHIDTLLSPRLGRRIRSNWERHQQPVDKAKELK